MKVPEFDWIPFNEENPPSIPVSVYGDEKYIIFFREAMRFDDSAWWYHTDIATPNGSYLGNFWDTENDWDEGQKIEVLAYAKFPVFMIENELKE